MNIAMMGTGPFAVPTFQMLADEHEVNLLVTRPAPVRKVKAPENPMRAHAQRLGIEVFDPPDVNSSDSVARLKSLNPDLLVVCDYGQILSAELLGVTPLGGINLHGSLLPRYRGAAPVNWAILNGDETTGVTVIHMTPKLDAGPELARWETPIDPLESAVELEQRLSLAGVAPVTEALAMLSNWDRQSAIGVMQDARLATRAPRLKKTDGLVDWSQPATAIQRQIRGLKPWPGTYCYYPRKKGTVRLILDHATSDSGHLADAQPGTVILASQDQLLVATGDGVLSIHRLQPAGKRVMEVSEFLRGQQISAGTRLGDA